MNKEITDKHSREIEELNESFAQQRLSFGSKQSEWISGKQFGIQLDQKEIINQLEADVKHLEIRLKHCNIYVQSLYRIYLVSNSTLEHILGDNSPAYLTLKQFSSIADRLLTRKSVWKILWRSCPSNYAYIGEWSLGKFKKGIMSDGTKQTVMKPDEWQLSFPKYRSGTVDETRFEFLENLSED